MGLQIIYYIYWNDSSPLFCKTSSCFSQLINRLKYWINTLYQFLKFIPGEKEMTFNVFETVSVIY